MADLSDIGTRQTVLDLVIEKGPVTSGAIARILGLTTAAVRRHITTLEESGEIEEHDVPPRGPRGRGRPARYYVATDTGRGTLTDGHSEIAVKALSYMTRTMGEEAVEAFASSRAREIERKYTPIVHAAGSDPLMRASALADALTEDGYAASIRPVGDGHFAVQLCQGHCPIEKVAEEFPQLCEAELTAFSKILGVHVQRLSTLAGGGHVCTTHVPIGMPVVHPAARHAFRRNR
ncbi:HTH domain-containing protein [Actinomycetaceae bacterium WB03_NA08]|uniref:HTH domain-containing protein n=1 Tax=Scrofimicrobium canadense TaxID=2652290 RepID=A0A6N7W632_9ACTO|nr:helix-turn-helix domain-containing protein [Scrofimicrobium canadense]MSS83953.1 HTH domain-containing protein [Scrofimicrobium canadense]